MNRLDYEVVTARGAVIKTYPDRKAAVRYAGENAEVFPGLAVLEVIHREPERRRVWTSRAHLRVVAA